MDAFYNVVKDLYCKINAFIFNFIFLKESWKMYHAFHKNIKQHNCLKIERRNVSWAPY